MMIADIYCLSARGKKRIRKEKGKKRLCPPLGFLQLAGLRPWLSGKGSPSCPP